MKNDEIKALTQEELLEHIEIERDNLRKLKFAHAITPIENPMKIRKTRRLIAKLNTEFTQRKLQN